MTYRFVAAAVTASAVVAVGAGCSAQADKVSQKTAHITIDGNTQTSHAVSCTQVQWVLTVDIDAAPARVQMVLNLEHSKPKPETVDFENVNGFTGVANSEVGNVQAGFAGDTYTVTGSAQGTNPNDVNHPRTADFKVSANC